MVADLQRSDRARRLALSEKLHRRVPIAAIAGRQPAALVRRARTLREDGVHRLQPQSGSVWRLFQFAADDRQVVVPALREDDRSRRAVHDPRLRLLQSGDAHHRLVLSQRRHHGVHAGSAVRPVQDLSQAEIHHSARRRRGAVPLGPFPRHRPQQRQAGAGRDHGRQHLFRHLRLSPAGHRPAHQGGADRQHSVCVGNGRRGEGQRPANRLRLRRHQALCRQRADQRRRPQEDLRGQCAARLSPAQDPRRSEGDGVRRRRSQRLKALAKKGSAKSGDALKQRRAHIIRIGTREMESHGAPGGFWTDLYHRSMTVHWPAFFGSAALIFIVLNAVFGFLFGRGREPIANVSPELPLPLSLFYFSIETLATVGYGDMHPQTNYGHLVATIEIFTGMSFLAVITGLIFARFSRPRARFVFADYPVVTTHQGQPTLMMRVANARHNTISQATARLWLFRMERTLEGRQYRRYHELLLERREHPMFGLSWSIFHTIDETSPLYRMTAQDLAEVDAAFALNLSGVDDSSAQHLYARQLYSGHDIKWQHRYVDISSVSPAGRMVIDYSMFHEVEPEDE